MSGAPHFGPLMASYVWDAAAAAASACGGSKDGTSCVPTRRRPLRHHDEPLVRVTAEVDFYREICVSTDSSRQIDAPLAAFDRHHPNQEDISFSFPSSLTWAAHPSLMILIQPPVPAHHHHHHHYMILTTVPFFPHTLRTSPSSMALHSSPFSSPPRPATCAHRPHP